MTSFQMQSDLLGAQIKRDQSVEGFVAEILAAAVLTNTLDQLNKELRSQLKREVSEAQVALRGAWEMLEDETPRLISDSGARALTDPEVRGQLTKSLREITARLEVKVERCLALLEDG